MAHILMVQHSREPTCCCKFNIWALTNYKVWLFEHCIFYTYWVFEFEVNMDVSKVMSCAFIVFLIQLWFIIIIILPVVQDCNTYAYSYVIINGNYKGVIHFGYLFNWLSPSFFVDYLFILLWINCVNKRVDFVVSASTIRIRVITEFIPVNIEEMEGAVVSEKFIPEVFRG